MKCACDRCERVVSMTSEEFIDKWRRIVVTKTLDRRNGPIDRFAVETEEAAVHLCDRCFNDFLGFANGPHRAESEV